MFITLFSFIIYIIVYIFENLMKVRNFNLFLKGIFGRFM